MVPVEPVTNPITKNSGTQLQAHINLKFSTFERVFYFSRKSDIPDHFSLCEGVETCDSALDGLTGGQWPHLLAKFWRSAFSEQNGSLEFTEQKGV